MTSKVPDAAFTLVTVIVPENFEAVLTRALGTLVEPFELPAIVFEELLVSEFEVLLVAPAVKLELTAELVVVEVASSSILDRVASLLSKAVGFSAALTTSFFHSKL
ncbi:Uncharacterised protein [Streptococcus suis]|uniref:Uncharacterized protein n=1 Tax=Streptococcus suis TaxID=1307 RepID=A0A0Z8HFI9_STRSU|nr:Uncharacterised protein [Streptococcus suis]CYW27099.1 Uncharacterised protein [Streptococcus suis]